MSTTANSDALKMLLAGFEAGKQSALARAVSMVENQRDGFDQLLMTLHHRLGRARRIGITGPPGAGKSTLTARLVSSWRAAGLRVGVIAVDPTSPFTGGALLGDRIRMEAIALDTGVFIRSLATRGSLGGISSATRAVADVMDAFGFDRIIMETVGVGQSELDIARVADTTVVVVVPESGDSIQALKAGLMEIADIYVVNKADRPGAERVRNDIELMLGMRYRLAGDATAHHGVDLKAVANPGRAAREAALRHDDKSWTPPVQLTSAQQGVGVDELAGAMDRHALYLESSGELRVRRRHRLRDQIVEVAEHRFRRRLWGNPEVTRLLDDVLPRIERGEASPWGVADELLQRGLRAITGNVP